MAIGRLAMGVIKGGCRVGSKLARMLADSLISRIFASDGIGVICTIFQTGHGEAETFTVGNSLGVLRWMIAIATWSKSDID